MREERRAGIDPGGRGCHDACLLPLLASGPEPATDGLDGSSKGPGVSRASSATLYLKLTGVGGGTAHLVSLPRAGGTEQACSADARRARSSASISLHGQNYSPPPRTNWRRRRWGLGSARPTSGFAHRPRFRTARKSPDGGGRRRGRGTELNPEGPATSRQRPASSASSGASSIPAFGPGRPRPERVPGSHTHSRADAVSDPNAGRRKSSRISGSGPEDPEALAAASPAAGDPRCPRPWPGAA